MSLLGVRRKKTRAATSTQWPFRMLFILLGLGVAWTGWEAIEHGYWWIRDYNPRLGIVAVGPSLGFVFMGALFVLMGLIPWPRTRKEPKSKNDMYEIR